MESGRPPAIQPEFIALQLQRAIQQQISSSSPINVTSGLLGTRMPFQPSVSVPNTVPVTYSTAARAPQPVTNSNSGALTAGAQLFHVKPAAPTGIQSSFPGLSASGMQNLPSGLVYYMNQSPGPRPASMPMPVSVVRWVGNQQSVAPRFNPPNSALSAGQEQLQRVLRFPQWQWTAAPPNEVGTNQGSTSASQEKVENWMDVVHTRQTSSTVKGYFPTNEALSEVQPDKSFEKNSAFNIQKMIFLKPDTAYTFRVAAINSCGRGPWGEVTELKTCLPGFPGPPRSVKITKSDGGATIAWQSPLATLGDILPILEYSVYLAVKPSVETPEPRPGVATYSFVRLYCGPDNQCFVSTNELATALLDKISRPAIIFRISAKNEKGAGPATQVRWLQEEASTANLSSPTRASKRSVPSSPNNASAKLGRTE